MSIKDWGLKCGIEIHQQLEGKKLFCHCPTLLREDKADFTIERKLRASAGEGGKIDVAAQAEQAQGKSFVYEGYYDSTCLVELDEEPPHELNQDALHTALQFSLLAQSTISPIIQVMRKTVVDGSNTSGFQRTALVARHGQIDTSEGTVRLMNISLEEDSAKIITEKQVTKTYRLDRLGIPLIEIGTEADIVSAQQCQEAAKKIGLLLRSLPGVKRGLGTIRQDDNVSIKGGTRIEIKGAQDLHQLPLLVELEAKRQTELLRLKEQLIARVGSFNIVDVTEIMKTADSKIIKSTLEKKGKVLGLKLAGFAGILGKELVPGYRVGSELAGRAKILAGVGGIIHSDEYDRDEPKKYGLNVGIICQLEDALQVSTRDAYILVADVESRAKKALEVVYTRVLELYKGVPA